MTDTTAAAARGHDHPTSTPADERWLAATWPFVRAHLPQPPARVLEIGCGPLGGFVPALREHGYAATGVDPAAPEGRDYHRTEFERHELTAPLDAVVACTSLHHVADLGDVLDRVRAALVPGGVLVVVEWAHERFDEATARWCFDRLPDTAEPGWLHRHRDLWRESGEDWDAYLRGWAAGESLYRGRDIEAALRARFEVRSLVEAPYFFAELDGVTPEDEQAAVDAGVIRATGIRFVGGRPTLPG